MIGPGLEVENGKSLVTVRLEGLSLVVPKGANLADLQRLLTSIARRLQGDDVFRNKRLQMLVTMGKINAEAVIRLLKSTSRAVERHQERSWEHFNKLSSYPELLQSPTLTDPACLMKFLTGVNFDLNDVMPPGTKINSIATAQQALRLFAAIEECVFGEGLADPMRRAIAFIGPQQGLGVPPYAVVWFAEQLIAQYLDMSGATYVTLPSPGLLGQFMSDCGAPRDDPLVQRAQEAGLFGPVIVIQPDSLEFSERYVRMAKAAQPTAPSATTTTTGQEGESNAPPPSRGGNRGAGGGQVRGDSGGTRYPPGVCYKNAAHKLLDGPECDGKKCNRPHNQIGKKGMQAFLQSMIVRKMAEGSQEVKDKIKALSKKS
jgi:hypothetical protein